MADYRIESDGTVVVYLSEKATKWVTEPKPAVGARLAFKTKSDVQVCGLGRCRHPYGPGARAARSHPHHRGNGSRYAARLRHFGPCSRAGRKLRSHRARAGDRETRCSHHRSHEPAKHNPVSGQ